MWRALGWMVLAALCCVAKVAAGEERMKSMLLEAQAAFDKANRLQEAGQYTAALMQSHHALSLREAVLGNEHLEVANSLNQLGNLFLQRRETPRARALLERALAIRQAALGKHHPDVVHTLVELARLRLAQHRLAEALPLLMQAFTLSEEYLRQELLAVSESRRMSLLQDLRTDEERIYTLLRIHPDDARVRRLALTAVLLRKGRSIEESAITSRILSRGLGAQDRAHVEQLRALRTQSATLVLRGPGSLAPAEYQRRLEELTPQGERLEADLVRRVAPLRALITLPPPAEIVERVAATLSQDEALVELVAYTNRPPHPRPGAPVLEGSGPLHYLALVLFPGGRTGALDLGPAAPIDLATTDLRNALSSRDAAYALQAQTLYTLAFRPLLPLLGGVRRLFIAPDSQLGLVPFDVLHDGHHFLIEHFDFTYVTSGRDLLPRPQFLPASNSFVIIADPLFQAPWVPPSSTPRAKLAEDPWTPLPGTRQEALALQRLVPKAQLFLGPDATKERLLQLTAPAILHIATHGFLLENAAAPADSRALLHAGSFEGGTASRRPSDPLLRSGLVLTGARASASNLPGPSRNRPASALVTALELASLDLWGTELVVLSACDTGRGDVRPGQGIHGLRSALVIAGAETVVLSLWQVNDETTRLLMEDYYRHLLAGKGRAAALREAMRALRRTQPHPYYWAPFIALGRDTPLRTMAPDRPTPSNIRLSGADPHPSTSRVGMRPTWQGHPTWRNRFRLKE
jgi:CHAT domain-containing protein